MAAPAMEANLSAAPATQEGFGRASFQRFSAAILRNRKATAGLLLLLFLAFVAAFPQVFTRVDPNAAIYPQAVGPSGAHWLGTTQVGQDVYAQLIWGTRLTLIITVVAGGGATLLSVLFGVAAAYFGGMVDRVLSVFIDIFLIIPTLPLLIILAAYLTGAGTVAIIAALIVTGWAFSARQLRSQGLSLRTRDFLEAARVRGERSMYVIFAEILPTMTSLLVANFMGLATYMVATAAGLQFLGLGNTSEVTWGTMLYYAQNNDAIQGGSNPWWALAPGFAVVLMGVAFALLNYAFDEIGNPALRAVRRPRARRAA
ncbi:MAG TPA: ABC transporter permease [Candidatus Binatia bacterium]|nr:ABC transporter permease [Candidatus Binatia bacterium]